MGGFKRRLVLDFDGVLHSYTSGWRGVDVVPDPPVPGAVEFLVEATRRFEVHVYSTRSSERAGRVAMFEAVERWLDESDFSQDEIQRTWASLVFPDSKPAAHLTIDDRALTFTGVFPSLDEVDAFVPWNKRAEPLLKTCFMVSRFPTGGYWDLFGLYTTREAAIASCRYGDDVVTEIPLGVDFTGVTDNSYPMWRADQLRPDLTGTSCDDEVST